ncbi:MAG: hypothetical protein ACREKQ_14390 [Candidatus Rokuibacteriota bacterium]
MRESSGLTVREPIADHVLTAVLALAAAIAAAVVASVAIRVRLLPEVIDISIIPTGAGVGGLLAAFVGALRGFEPGRLGRLTLFGTLVGGGILSLLLVVALLDDVLS